LADLFAVPAGELANHVIPLESLPGNDGKALGEQMLHALNNRERMIFMINFFRSRMNRSQFNQGACLSVIRQMVHAGSLLRVDQLAKESFLSFRQFERNFKQLTGFSPKKYSRILRFQSATRLYGNKGKNLTDIAHECGYYDQSHFIHEFKQFSGYHPKQYFSGRSEAVAWKEANKQN
jgi:AraC-like DNA-binding protein